SGLHKRSMKMYIIMSLFIVIASLLQGGQQVNHKKPSCLRFVKLVSSRSSFIVIVRESLPAPFRRAVRTRACASAADRLILLLQANEAMPLLPWRIGVGLHPQPTR